MTPDASTLPRLRRWTLSDATLRWTATVSGKQSLSVRGFGMTLECVAFVKHDYYEKRRKGEDILTKFLGWIGMAARRVPPSAADPTNLVEGNQKLETEDDILHLKKLPSFGGRLSAQDSEVLLQYLTAPYIRIPLVLQFFADETRLDSLVCSELQYVVMAVLFEPSLWQRQRFKEAPEEIPTRTREPLSTPLGLLFNELTFSPNTILQALEDMLDIAIDKDTGQYAGHSADLLLFVVRVVVVVDRSISFIINHSDHWDSAHHSHPSSNVESRLLSGCGYKSLARGLRLIRHEHFDRLQIVHRRLQRRLHAEILPLFESWASKAIRKSDLSAACSLYAHVASIFAHTTPSDYNESIVSCLVASLFFVFTHHRFTLEPSRRFQPETTSNRAPSEVGEVVGESLGVPDIELFGILQTHRRPLLEWMEQNRDKADRVMESTVRIVSFTGDRAAGEHETILDLLQDGRNHRQRQSECPVGGETRRWVEISGCFGRGRFVPDNEKSSLEAAQKEVRVHGPQNSTGLLSEREDKTGPYHS